MAQCITCGTTLHPDRARKYSYCMARECQEKNATSLTMVAVGMNKAADELLILDERTREDLASGKYRDQRRGSFGPPAPAPRPGSGPGALPGAAGSGTAGSSSAGSSSAGSSSGPPARRAPSSQPSRPRQSGQSGRSPAPRPVRRPWTQRQEKLALIYNEQGLRPAEIAGKLGLSDYTVTQIILAARNRAKG